MRNFVLASAALAGIVASANATFTNYSVVTTAAGALNVYQVYGNFNGATDTVLNAFQIHNTNGSGLIQGFTHNDALTGGAASTVSGTWNPQFVLAPGAIDSFL